jgi:hypothetical protein
MRKSSIRLILNLRCRGLADLKEERIILGLNSEKVDAGYKFIDDDHRRFYAEQTVALTNDAYHRALIYTLGLCRDTRCRFYELYDAQGQSINPAAVREAWQTPGSLRATRLAFNLFNDGVPSAYQNDMPDFDECRQYSVSDIFCSEYAPFFFEAVRIRYPEYTQLRRHVQV